MYNKKIKKTTVTIKSKKETKYSEIILNLNKNMYLYKMAL